MKLEAIRREEMADIYAAMQRNFISDELRDPAAALAVLDEEKYTVYHVLGDDGARLGFICIWELGRAAFVEHFVIYDAYRGKGCGGEAIDCVCRKFGKVVLEVEKPEDEIKRRRIAFYRRHGFEINSHPCVQPAYRADSGRVPMYLMTYPAPTEDFDGLAGELYETVYHEKYLRSDG